MIRTILNQAMQKGMLKDIEAYLDEKFFELSQIQEKSEYEEEWRGQHGRLWKNLENNKNKEKI